MTTPADAVPDDKDALKAALQANGPWFPEEAAKLKSLQSQRAYAQAQYQRQLDLAHPALARQIR